MRHAVSAVTVSLNERPGEVEFWVADDGPGVPPDARTRIFERFGRAEPARTRGTHGAGLGLAIVRDIVEHHGGSVCYDDTWSGARFVVQLPTQPRSSVLS